MMNPGGPVEEAGATVRSGIEALKSTPVVLAVLIFNIAWMGVIAWTTHESGERWERTIERTIKYCVPAEGGSKSRE